MNLLKALGTVSGLTMLSRVLAFVRDVLIARIFGAGEATDAFFVAFKLPNLLRRMFAEGAFSQAFVPILGEYKTRRSEQETRDLLDHVTAMLALVLFIITLIGMIAAPLIIYVTAPGFADNQTQYELSVQMLRLTMPYIFFISMVALAAGVLNLYNRFWVPAFAPVLLNICFIAAALWLAPYCDPPIMALAWAVFIAGFAQLLFQLPFLHKLGMMPRPKLNWKHSGMRRVVRQMVPALFGVSVSQINLIINTVFASMLAAGSVSWLYYADRLMEFPAGVLGAALGTILLPSLSKCFADERIQDYSRLMDWGLRLTVMLAVPSTVALALLGVPLLSTFFQYGAFDAQDVEQTQQALLGYSVGLVGLILVKILAPGFYARQDIKTPVKIGVVTLLFTQTLNLILIFGLGMGHAALALSISLGACLNASILFYFLRRHNIYQPHSGWPWFLLRVSVAVSVMGLGLWQLMGTEQQWYQADVWWKIGHLSLLVIGGMLTYFAVLYLLGFRIRDFSRRAID